MQKENLEDITAHIRNHHIPAVSQATAAHEDAVKVLDNKTKVLDAAHVTWKQAKTQLKTAKASLAKAKQIKQTTLAALNKKVADHLSAL